MFVGRLGGLARSVSVGRRVRVLHPRLRVHREHNRADAAWPLIHEHEISRYRRQGPGVLAEYREPAG